MNIDLVCADDLVELLPRDAGRRLEAFEVDGRRVPTKPDVSFLRQRRLIDDALAPLVIDAVLETPGLWEDVVDVDLHGEEMSFVERLAQQPIVGLFRHEER